MLLVITASFALSSAHWVHKGFSGLGLSLDNVVNFKCRTCLNPAIANDKDSNLSLIVFIMSLLIIFAILVTFLVQVKAQKQVQCPV